MFRRRTGEANDRGVLLDHVLRTADAERQDLAHRLHDGPQQVMTAIRLVADGARHALEQGDVEGARAGLARLEQLAAEAADDLRRMSGGLHPVVMEQRGLLQALSSLVETLEAEHHVRASLGVDGTWPAGDPDRDTAIYQVARESCLEAARAGARSIEIALSASPGTVALEVRAHGCAGHERGTELLLRERAARIGGRLEVREGEPVGVRLTAPAR
jgi:signal transduction histidine kinase